MDLSQGMAVHLRAGAESCLHIHYLAVPIESKLSSAWHFLWVCPLSHLGGPRTRYFLCISSSSKSSKYCKINISVHQHSSYISHRKEVVAVPRAWCEGIWGVWECKCFQEQNITKFIEILSIFSYNEGPSKWTITQTITVLLNRELLSYFKRKSESELILPICKTSAIFTLSVSSLDGQNNCIAAVRRNGSIWDSIPVTHLQPVLC